jgi:hypothetical protein
MAVAIEDLLPDGVEKLESSVPDFEGFAYFLFILGYSLILFIQKLLLTSNKTEA